MTQSVKLPLTYFYKSQSGEKSDGMHTYGELMDTVFDSFDAFLKYDTFICGCGLHIHVGGIIAKELEKIDRNTKLHFKLWGVYTTVWDYLAAEIKNIIVT